MMSHHNMQKGHIVEHHFVESAPSFSQPERCELTIFLLSRERTDDLLNQLANLAQCRGDKVCSNHASTSADVGREDGSQNHRTVPRSAHLIALCTLFIITTSGSYPQPPGACSLGAREHHPRGDAVHHF